MYPLDYTDDAFTSHRPQVSQSREDAMFAQQIDSGHWSARKTDVSKLKGTAEADAKWRAADAAMRASWEARGMDFDAWQRGEA